MQGVSFEIFDYDNHKIIEVAESDLNLNDLTWHEAYALCQRLGNGWRLPTVAELVLMNQQLHCKQLGNFRLENPYYEENKKMKKFFSNKIARYWSDRPSDYYSSISFGFHWGNVIEENWPFEEPNLNRHFARAVRDNGSL
jgi:hypothetical protein